MIKINIVQSYCNPKEAQIAVMTFICFKYGIGDSGNLFS